MPDFFDDPFHSIAAACYAIVMAETGKNPPDSKKVKDMAYAEYERLRGQNAGRSADRAGGNRA